MSNTDSSGYPYPSDRGHVGAVYDGGEYFVIKRSPPELAVGYKGIYGPDNKSLHNDGGGLSVYVPETWDWKQGLYPKEWLTVEKVEGKKRYDEYERTRQELLVRRYVFQKENEDKWLSLYMGNRSELTSPEHATLFDKRIGEILASKEHMVGWKLVLK